MVCFTQSFSISGSLSRVVLPISRALESSGVSFASSQETKEEKECGGLSETLEALK